MLAVRPALVSCKFLRRRLTGYDFGWIVSELPFGGVGEVS